MTLPADPDALLAQIAGWPRESLEALQAGIGRILASAEPVAATPERLPRVPGVTLRREYVQCGKAGCTRCPHGPYWYAYWREGARLRKRYLGKQLPSEGDLAALRRPA